MTNIAINGFGRIGRQILEVGARDNSLKFIAINDLTDTKTLAHLLKHDSVFGTSDLEISYTDKELIINNKRIAVFAEKDPEKLPWKELKIDIVVESTGLFTEREGAMKHITAGAKKVLISAPAKNPDITIVKGVNDKSYDKKIHHIISNASCTTNCLAPIVKVLNDNFTVQNGFMVTAHAYTADQRLVDAQHKDLRRARSAAINIIPTTTGAAKTVAEVIPELKGKLDGLALRVPVPCGSLVDFTCNVKKATTIDEINKAFKNAGLHNMKGIIQYSEEPLVSTDIIKNRNSAIFDSCLTNVIDGTLIKVVGWYDNEWGYSCRMVDILKMLL